MRAKESFSAEAGQNIRDRTRDVRSQAGGELVQASLLEIEISSRRAVNACRPARERTRYGNHRHIEGTGPARAGREIDPGAANPA